MNESETSADLWTQILDFLSQIVTPLWNELIGLLPIALTGLVLLVLGLVALQWRRASAINRSRVRPRLRPAPPAGVHLPGPSRWPFVVPIGAMLLFFGLALAPRDESGNVSSPVNVPLLGAGLLVTGVAVAGWLLDAMREWRHTAAEPPLATAHGTALDAPLAGTLHAGSVVTGPALAPAPARRLPPEPPPGIHMPGPSPWPLFAPVALMVMFAGLVFGPILIVAGIAMGLIAAAGWYRDAGREYRQTDAGHAPDPVTRDPEQAFPKRLVPVYATIGALAVALTLAPLAFSMLPGGGGGGGAEPSASGGGEVPAEPYVSASSSSSFDQTELLVPAGEPFPLVFENKHSGVPHNVAIYESPARAQELFNGELVTGPATVTYEVDALESGEYFFVCIVHPPMTGTVIASE